MTPADFEYYFKEGYDDYFLKEGGELSGVYIWMYGFRVARYVNP